MSPFISKYLAVICIRSVPGTQVVYIFGDHFCLKSATMLRFHVFLHFNARKHMTSLFFLKWTEFTRNCEFVPIYFESPGIYNWSKIHNILWIWSTSFKMMMSYVFQHEIEGIHGIWASWHYSSKSSRQKYTAWVPGDPTPRCYYNDVSFWRNI